MKVRSRNSRILKIKIQQKNAITVIRLIILKKLLRKKLFQIFTKIHWSVKFKFKLQVKFNYHQQ